MVLNLLRTGVGIQSVSHIRDRQRQYTIDIDGKTTKAVFVHTRYQPKRSDEILDTKGSIFWIIKGHIQCRQRILGFEKHKDEDDKDFCRILLDPEIIRTERKRQRHIQGWRYLEQDKAPPDMETGQDDGIEDMPEDMISELQELGLL